MSGTRNVQSSLLPRDTFPLQRFSWSGLRHIRSGWLKIFPPLLLKMGWASLKQHLVAANYGVQKTINNIMQYTPSCYILQGKQILVSGVYMIKFFMGSPLGVFKKSCLNIIFFPTRTTPSTNLNPLSLLRLYNAQKFIIIY